MAKKATSDLAPKQQVEALLFSSGKTMSEEQLCTLTGLEKSVIRGALTALQTEYEGRDGAITVFNDPTGWKMMIRDRYVPVVKNIVADTELTRACMETLAIIAYKYPKVLQSEVIEIRGSGAYDHMAELERLGFIRREPEGRSFAVKLTEKFFSYFDVAGGKDIREVFKNVRVPKRIAQDAQKTLGDLSVVDVAPLPTQPPKPLAGMDVVDVPPEQERQEALATVEDLEEEVEAEVQQERAPEPQNEGYLDDLDKRIAQLTKRNDELDGDEAFKRKPLPGMEDVTESKTDE